MPASAKSPKTTTKKTTPTKSQKKAKIYVLDTSVIIHDHNSIHNFEDNDVVIPITVLKD